MNIFKNRQLQTAMRFVAVLVGIFTVFSAVAYFRPETQEPIVAQANSNCNNATATTPTWNPFPLSFTDINAQPNGACTDIPMLSFFPIQTANNNPRQQNFLAGESVDVHFYYNNGANVNAANTLMTNPRARLEMTKVSDTQYRLRGYLSADNAQDITSQATQYGGDLIINVPSGATLEPDRRQTNWFPQEGYRREAFEDGQNVPVSEQIDDDLTVAPPLLRQDGFQLYTPTDANINQVQRQGLEAGFEDNGYFLMQWNVVPAQQTNNNPPIVPGQEITIVRGNTGSFDVIIGTDPDGDTPLTYEVVDLPDFCVYNETTRIVTCTTDQNTPVRTTFTVIPTDSRGLVGTPGVFIVNVIEPDDTNQPPTVPGQEITIVRGNDGSFQVINGSDPDGDTPLTYQIGNLPSFCTYDQSTRIITCSTNEQTPVRTTFTVTPIDSKGLSGQPATFIVNVIEPDLNINKTCVEAGTNTACDQAGLSAGDNVTYTITIQNAASAAAQNAVVTDDYDQNYIENVRNINPTEASHDTTEGELTWNLGTIEVGASVTIKYDATIQGDVTDGTTIRNVATVTADNLDPKEDEVTFPVGSQLPVLSQSDKVCFESGTSTNCDSANLTIGDKVTYYINVRNTGEGVAKNVRVVDTYDRARLTSVTNIQPNGTLSESAGTITWQVGDIAPGQTRTLSFEATIAQTVTNGSVIVNNAQITADNLPPRTVTVQFPVGIPLPPKTERSGGVAFFLILLGFTALGAGVYYYKKTNKLATGFVPSRSTEMKDSKKK